MVDENDPLPFEEKIDVVVLEAGSGCTVSVAGHIPVNLVADVEPVGDLLTELLAATVQVRADEGTPPEVLNALRDLPVPAAFRTSPWLDASRAIVLHDGAVRIDELTARYSGSSGLRIGLLDFDSDTAPDAGPGPDLDDDDKE